MEKQDKKIEKLTDKAFSRAMLFSVLGILLCITCLCSATWAWFTASTSNGGNVLSAASFDLDVTVASDGARTVDVVLDDGVRVCTFTDAGEYLITLSITEDSDATKGYCTLHVGDATYKTDAIKRDESNPFIFKLVITEAGTVVTFDPSWGLPAMPDVELGGTLTVGALTPPEG